MRRPEPWYWAARKGWYVQLNKKQVKLGDESNPKPNPKPPADVMREYHRLMSSEGLLTAKERSGATVPEVCEALLAVKEKLRKSTYRNYVWYFRIISNRFMKKQFSALRVAEIENIADSQKTWGSATKHDFITHVITPVQVGERRWIHGV